MKNSKLTLFALVVTLLMSCKKDPLPTLEKSTKPVVATNSYDTTTIKADNIDIYLLNNYNSINTDTCYAASGHIVFTIDTFGRVIDSVAITGWSGIAYTPSDSSLRANIIPTGAICELVSYIKVRKNEKTRLQIRDDNGIMCTFPVNIHGILGNPYQFKTHTIGCVENNSHDSQVFLFY